MIQRIQTLYLLGAFILTLLLITGPITTYSIGEEVYELSHSGFTTEGDGSPELATWPLTVLLGVTALLSFLNIFFYKHRNRQIRICVFLIVVFAGMLGMFIYYTQAAAGFFDEPIIIYRWRFVIPPVNMILLYLAFRGIRKDEVMVKAFDRLR